FDLAPRLAEEGVVLRPPLPRPRLEPVGPVAHPVGRDRREDPPVHPPAPRRGLFSEPRDHRLEGRERPDRPPKLIDRGPVSCRAAARAVTARVGSYAGTWARTSRTGSGVFPRGTPTRSVRFNDRGDRVGVR